MCGFLCNKVAFDELRMGGSGQADLVHELRVNLLTRNIAISDMHIKKITRDTMV